MHDHDPNCLFCRIIKGEIPSRKVYEDDEVFARPRPTTLRCWAA